MVDQIDVEFGVEGNVTLRGWLFVPDTPGPRQAITMSVRVMVSLTGKGTPLTFPGHVHQLMYPATPAVTWFDVVRSAGWNDQPSADRSHPV
jgi:hypothetical protein